jgi:hypothetical protein
MPLQDTELIAAHGFPIYLNHGRIFIIIIVQVDKELCAVQYVETWLARYPALSLRRILKGIWLLSLRLSGRVCARASITISPASSLKG